VNGSLAIKFISDQPLTGIYKSGNSNASAGIAIVGVSTAIHFNASAILTVPILGSIRTIRDFTEGPSILVPEIQDAIKFSKTLNDGALLSRLWLDNRTMTQLAFSPMSGGARIDVKKKSIELKAGTYKMDAVFNYPQLTQLTAAEVLAPGSQDLINQQAGKTTSLSFLSYTDKLLAGAWRFLTYFGRDSMITLLLMQPVLSEGQGGAIEAVIGAVLERINKYNGKVCHEETIGDYATYLHSLDNITSTKALCSYVMVDTDYYLAPVMENYFLKTSVGRNRTRAFFAQKAVLDFGDKGMSYAALALLNAEHVMSKAAAFAAKGGQTKHNLVHLERDQIVGEWRDSTYGIGGGRIPYDVNTALVPAALRSIAALSAAGFFPSRPEWKTQAAAYAKVWEDETLQFFAVTIPQSKAQSLVKAYAKTVNDGFPSQADKITSDVTFHGLSLDGNNNLAKVEVMNTDDCFRLFLLNTTNEAQLTAFVNQTATNIQQPFPVGLSTDVGILVANPAYGAEGVYAKNWTHNAYHGTVIWSWPMAMLAAGLQRQLERCSPSANTTAPEFCSDKAVYGNVVKGYNHLWNMLEANEKYLSNEVWSWQYRKGAFEFIALGALPPPAGSSKFFFILLLEFGRLGARRLFLIDAGPTESDIRQLWSLTFLAVTRDKSLK